LHDAGATPGKIVMIHFMSSDPCVPVVPIVPPATAVQEVGIPLRYDPPFMLWWIVGVHLAWAGGLIFEPTVLTKAIALVGLDWLVEWGLSSTAIAAVLGSCALLAAAGLVLEKWTRDHLRPRAGLAFMAGTLLPQYFLVLIAFTSDVWLLLNPPAGQSGQPVASWILITVLFPVVWGALLHTAAILLRAELAVRGFPPWPPRGQRGRWVAIWKPE
jgi:hypothetical protein